MEIAIENNWNWEAELMFNPDKELAEQKEIVISSDRWILDRVDRWFNLNAHLLEKDFIRPKPLIIFAK